MPWAIALGVTERWILAFEGLKVDEPSWYTGDGPFTLSTYDRALASFGKRLEDAILTSRRSSGRWSGAAGSGSGFSGGSQGGGFGGGGGGTFQPTSRQRAPPVARRLSPWHSTPATTHPL